MIPRTSFKPKKVAADVDEKIYRRFPVHKQAFATVGLEDTGRLGITYSLEKMWQNMAGKMFGGVPGHSRFDHALEMGANAMNLLLGSYGYPNSQFLKWDPLFVPDFLQGNKVAADAAQLTAQVKEAARLYGSDLTGIASLDSKWVYSEDLFKPFNFTTEGPPRETEEGFLIPESVNKAVVLAVAMPPDLSEASPTVPASTAANIGYSRMGITAVSLAEYIRSLGYTAIPCMNDTALSIPLAVEAGLGELGRHGLFITPEYGPCVRLCKVLTDMPLLADRPYNFGISDFCRQCLLCADHCPPRAISYHDPSYSGVCANNNPGVKKWYIDATACLRYWQHNGASCANCISSCPFFYGFVDSQCLECVRCDTTDGCSLHYITHLRLKHGYLKQKLWGTRSSWTPQIRTGL
jgi:reductive dehalogenase